LTENHKRDGPSPFLANYAGSLHADAFKGCDGIYTGSHGKILEVACAYARRKFFEPRSSSSAEASLIPEMIRRLYDVENRGRPLDDAGPGAMRQTEAVPILGRLWAELDRLKSKLLPTHLPVRSIRKPSVPPGEKHGRRGRCSVQRNSLGSQFAIFLSNEIHARPRQEICSLMARGSGRAISVGPIIEMPSFSITKTATHRVAGQGAM